MTMDSLTCKCGHVATRLANLTRHQQKCPEANMNGVERMGWLNELCSCKLQQGEIYVTGTARDMFS
jgi:hypothetical protein